MDFISSATHFPRFLDRLLIRELFAARKDFFTLEINERKARKKEEKKTKLYSVQNIKRQQSLN